LPEKRGLGPRVAANLVKRVLVVEIEYLVDLLGRHVAASLANMDQSGELNTQNDACAGASEV